MEQVHLSLAEVIKTELAELTMRTSLKATHDDRRAVCSLQPRDWISARVSIQTGRLHTSQIVRFTWWDKSRRWRSLKTHEGWMKSCWHKCLGQEIQTTLRRHSECRAVTRDAALQESQKKVAISFIYENKRFQYSHSRVHVRRCNQRLFMHYIYKAVVPTDSWIKHREYN